MLASQQSVGKTHSLREREETMPEQEGKNLSEMQGDVRGMANPHQWNRSSF